MILLTFHSFDETCQKLFHIYLNDYINLFSILAVKKDKRGWRKPI